MRWEYESPEDELFVVDPPNVWFYVPADHTVSRAKLKESSDWRTPLALLVGNTNLTKLCRSIQIADPAALGKSASSAPTPGDTVLQCLPRGSQPRDKNDVLLETDPEGQLVRVVIHEPGDARTEFRFGNWEENVQIPEAKFHFQPPVGVAIVENQNLPGELH
jgi:outer membrane lipoprotein-sorting protein